MLATRSPRAITLIITTITLLFCSIETNAQFDGIFSQYYDLKHMYNPAAVGDQEMMSVMLAQRLDWIGIKGAPKTTYCSADTPFKIKKTNHAAGIQFISDVFGIYANQQINAQYAYLFKIKKGTLSVGVNLGVINIICYGDSVKMVESDYHTPNDPAIPLGTQSGVGFDLGTGVFYNHPDWYAGISVLHLPASNIRLGDKYDFKTHQLMTVMGGYNFTLPNKAYQIKPSAMIYSDFRSWQMHITLQLDYKSKFWGGLSYSIQRAVSFNFGAQIINGLRFGYNYDLPASRIIRSTHGSHELFLSYDFNILRQKNNNKHKSVRLL